MNTIAMVNRIIDTTGIGIFTRKELFAEYVAQVEENKAISLLRMLWIENKSLFQELKKFMKLRKKNADVIYKEVEMAYSHYKKTYDNYETVKGSYNKAHKTIKVLVPESIYNRIMKKAGNSLKYYNANFKDNETGKTFSILLNYFTNEGVEKQVKDYCKKNNCTEV